ncbi:Ubiquinone biosynthesis accessory factor UbiT [Gammaproteobacteria bacterium]
MVESNSAPHASPLFPALLAAPLGLVPVAVHSTALAFALNRLFARQIKEGEMDFLADRVIAIEIRDARLAFRLTLSGGQLAAASRGPVDLIVGGSVYDLLLLATGREDPDTLFFQRRLSLDGDTELGLYVKNFLNSQDPQEVLPAPLRLFLPHLAPLYDRLFGSKNNL